MTRNQLIMVIVILGFISVGAIIPSIRGEVIRNDVDYVPDDFYRGYNSEEPLDYRRIYGDHTQSKYAGAKSCSTKDVAVSSGKSPYKPKGAYGLFWFWPLTKADESILTSGKELGAGKTLFEVPVDTELIAIADSHLVSKTQFPLSMYPSGDYSPGVHLGYIIKLPKEEIAFKVTYESLEKWWVCKDKVEADEYVDGKPFQPKYYVGTTFTDEKQFYSGTVVGFSGLSGVPVSQRTEKKSYVIVKVERATLDEEGNLESDWSSASVSDLY